MQKEYLNRGIGISAKSLLMFGTNVDKSASKSKITYTRRKEFTFPECCIVNVKDGQFSHFALYYKGNYYDKIDIDYDNIIGFLEIIVK